MTRRRAVEITRTQPHRNSHHELRMTDNTTEITIEARQPMRETLSC